MRSPSRQPTPRPVQGSASSGLPTPRPTSPPIVAPTSIPTPTPGADGGVFPDQSPLSSPARQFRSILDGGGGLSTGGTVGIAVGVTAAVVLGVLMGVLWKRRVRGTTNKPENYDDSYPGDISLNDELNFPASSFDGTSESSPAAIPTIIQSPSRLHSKIQGDADPSEATVKTSPSLGVPVRPIEEDYKDDDSYSI